MKALKMTISVLSLLIFVMYFATAAPMVQAQKTTPSDETTHQVIPSSKQGKKLNFIQKFILKKVGKKMKKRTDEDKYRKWAKLSVILGSLAIPSLIGISILGNTIARTLSKTITFTAFGNILLGLAAITFLTFMIASIILGAKAAKNTKDESTRKKAIIGKRTGVFLLVLTILLAFAIIILASM